MFKYVYLKYANMSLFTTSKTKTRRYLAKKFASAFCNPLSSLVTIQRINKITRTQISLIEF